MQAPADRPTPPRDHGWTCVQCAVDGPTLGAPLGKALVSLTPAALCEQEGMFLEDVALTKARTPLD